MEYLKKICATIFGAATLLLGTLVLGMEPENKKPNQNGTGIQQAVYTREDLEKSKTKAKQLEDIISTCHLMEGGTMFARVSQDTINRVRNQVLPIASGLIKDIETIQKQCLDLSPTVSSNLKELLEKLQAIQQEAVWGRDKPSNVCALNNNPLYALAELLGTAPRLCFSTSVKSVLKESEKINTAFFEQMEQDRVTCFQAEELIGNRLGVLKGSLLHIPDSDGHSEALGEVQEGLENLIKLKNKCFPNMEKNYKNLSPQEKEKYEELGTNITKHQGSISYIWGLIAEEKKRMGASLPSSKIPNPLPNNTPPKIVIPIKEDDPWLDVTIDAPKNDNHQANHAANKSPIKEQKKNEYQEKSVGLGASFFWNEPLNLRKEEFTKCEQAKLAALVDSFCAIPGPDELSDESFYLMPQAACEKATGIPHNVQQQQKNHARENQRGNGTLVAILADFQKRAEMLLKNLPEQSQYRRTALQDFINAIPRNSAHKNEIFAFWNNIDKYKIMLKTIMENPGDMLEGSAVLFTNNIKPASTTLSVTNPVIKLEPIAAPLIEKRIPYTCGEIVKSEWPDLLKKLTLQHMYFVAHQSKNYSDQKSIYRALESIRSGPPYVREKCRLQMRKITSENELALKEKSPSIGFKDEIFALNFDKAKKNKLSDEALAYFSSHRDQWTPRTGDFLEDCLLKMYGESLLSVEKGKSLKIEETQKAEEAEKEKRRLTQENAYQFFVDTLEQTKCTPRHHIAAFSLLHHEKYGGLSEDIRNRLKMIEPVRIMQMISLVQQSRTPFDEKAMDTISWLATYNRGFDYKRCVNCYQRVNNIEDSIKELHEKISKNCIVLTQCENEIVRGNSSVLPALEDAERIIKKQRDAIQKELHDLEVLKNKVFDPMEKSYVEITKKICNDESELMDPHNSISTYFRRIYHAKRIVELKNSIPTLAQHQRLPVAIENFEVPKNKDGTDGWDNGIFWRSRFPSDLRIEIAQCLHFEEQPLQVVPRVK
jgi:hypothetical protein